MCGTLVDDKRKTTSLEKCNRDTHQNYRGYEHNIGEEIPWTAKARRSRFQTTTVSIHCGP